MLSFEQCLKANRPLLFLSAESDIEVLKYLERVKKDDFFVYSTTLTNLIPLKELLNNRFCVSPKSKTTQQVLDEILRLEFRDSNNRYQIFVFLESENYIHDKQNIRKIKDILSRYQLDENYTVNLLFISQTVSVPPALERLGEVVFSDLPDEKELKDTSDRLAGQLELKGDNAPSDEVVSNLKGLTHFEVEQAYLQSWSMFKKVDLNFVRDFKKNAIAKTDLLALLETNLNFDSVGGMDILKEWVKKCSGGWSIEGQKFGLPFLKGLLLVGLPGCGKSLVCKAIGNQWGLPVIQFDPSRVFSSRVGDSEANIRRVLQIIENISPCVLMVDEIEKGFSGIQSSTFSDSGVTARVIGTFLIWMQECTKPVFTVATSNNIQYLPPELISRFDEVFFVNLPQFNERKEIFRIHLQRLNRDPNNFHLEQLANSSEFLSGREIEQVLRESMYDAFYQKKDLSDGFIKGCLKKKTSLIKTMGEQLKYLRDWVSWDDEKGDGLRARYAYYEDPEDRVRVTDEINKLIDDTEKGNSL